MSMRLQQLFLIAVASATLTFSALAQERAPRVALVIANASYPDVSSPLASTINDARAMADEIRRNNFDVDHKENVGSADMRRAVDAFLGKIRSGASALLYFNGIGIQVGRQTYLIPVDAQISAEAGVRRDGINLDATLAEMHRRGAKAKIVILDASRRNPFEVRFRTSAAGLAALDAPEGTIAIYSAPPGKVIADGAGANGLFATELIKELRVANRTAEEAFSRTRISVSRASNNDQVPWVATTMIEQFNLGQASSQVAAPPAPPPDPDAQARRDYQSAQQAGTKQAWDDFVARYPSGPYAESRPRPARKAHSSGGSAEARRDHCGAGCAVPRCAAPDDAAPRCVAPDDTATCRAATRCAAPDDAATCRAATRCAAPDDAATCRAAPRCVAPDDAASCRAAPRCVAPDDAASCRAAPRCIAPDDTASRRAAPRCVAPDDAASCRAAARCAAPDDAASHCAATHRVAPGCAAAGRAASGSFTSRRSTARRVAPGRAASCRDASGCRTPRRAAPGCVAPGCAARGSAAARRASPRDGVGTADTADTAATARRG